MALPGGELLSDFSARVTDWLENHKPSPTDIIVTHAGVIRVLRVLSGATWDEAMSSDNPFLGWTEYFLADS